MAGEYLDQSVNADRYEFSFSDAPLFNNVEEKELIEAAVEFIKTYLSDDLGKIKRR